MLFRSCASDKFKGRTDLIKEFETILVEETKVCDAERIRRKAEEERKAEEARKEQERKAEEERIRQAKQQEFDDSVERVKEIIAKFGEEKDE